MMTSKKLSVFLSSWLIALLAHAQQPRFWLNVKPAPIHSSLRNHDWGIQREKAFRDRARHAIEHFSTLKSIDHRNEYEKSTLPRVMFNYLAGHKDHALNEFVGLDEEAKITGGIDLYWCFTLKGQIRKYYLWKDELTDEYRKRFETAAKKLTAEDPRPTMELVHELRDPDPEVRAYALKLLQKMRETPEETLAKRCTNPDAKRALLEFAETDLAKKKFGADPMLWEAWWSFYVKRDWKVFEEVERVSNPRPHPEFGRGTGPVGTVWGPETRGGWIDPRNTDNLRAMRETSVYLLAEMSGNEKVRKLYKSKIRRFVKNMYTVGIGEWDSETYLGHTKVPYINLYDFAEDEEVKSLAKAALDWLATAMAVKYYNGGWAPPSKRDYGGACRAFGSDVTHLAYLWFGAPSQDPEPHYDDVHVITSLYRPPLAVWGLANKDFPRPVEIKATKPTYQLFLPGKSAIPEFWESIYFGSNYYVGSVASATGVGDMSPFGLLAENSTRGVDYFLAAPGARYNRKMTGTQISQHENNVMYLMRGSKAFSFQLPKSATVENVGPWWAVAYEKTWLGIYPIHLKDWVPATNPHHKSMDKDLDTIRYAKAIRGKDLTGFLLVVGDSKTSGSFESFKNALLQRVVPTETEKDEFTIVLPGRVDWTVRYNRLNDLPLARYKGKAVHYKIWDLWSTGATPTKSPVTLGWKQGQLQVRASNTRFVSQVSAAGVAQFADVH